MTPQQLRNQAGLCDVGYIDTKVLCGRLLGLPTQTVARAMGITSPEAQKRWDLASEQYRRTTGNELDTLLDFLQNLPEELQVLLLGELELELRLLMQRIRTNSACAYVGDNTRGWMRQRS